MTSDPRWKVSPSQSRPGKYYAHQDALRRDGTGFVAWHGLYALTQQGLRLVSKIPPNELRYFDSQEEAEEALAHALLLREATE